MIDFVAPRWPAPARIRAVCSTRVGGCSRTPFDSLNLALHVGDDPVSVWHNRERLRDLFDLPAEPEWLRQIHSSRVVRLESDSNREADAAITREPGRVAVVMTADCLPILICSQAGDEVAAVHAGWRGLQAGVIQAALASMQTPAQQLMAWIGPAISQAHFEVGDEVREAYTAVMPGSADFFEAHGAGHWLCDLPGLAQRVLERANVAAVYRDPHCSFRDQKLFYSYRREADTGRMAALIWIK